MKIQVIHIKPIYFYNIYDLSCENSYLLHSMQYPGVQYIVINHRHTVPKDSFEYIIPMYLKYCSPCGICISISVLFHLT
jgi:hypothetical protein